MAQSRHARNRAFRTVRYVGGDITLNSANWADVHASAFDVPLEAQVGDVLEATPNMRLNNTTAIFVWFDAVTVVSGTVTNSFHRAAAVTTAPPSYGVAAWKANSGVEADLGPAAAYTVVAGDIVDGKVTTRLRYATGGGARVLSCDGTNFAAFLTVKNLGPADPE